MQSVDLLVHGRWLLPIEPAGAVLEGYGIAVAGGRIVAVAPSAVLRRHYVASVQIDRPEHILMPGFVNAHTHAAMSLLRGAPARGSLGQWLRETIWPLENRWVSAEFVRTGTLLAIAQMLRAGITSFADMYLFPEEVARLAVELRLRIAIGLPVADARTAWSEHGRDCLAKGAALWDTHRASPWIRLYFAPYAPDSVSDEILRRLRRITDQLDAPVAMHLHETASAVRESVACHGRRPIARLADLGLLRPGFTGIHMIALDEDDLEIAQRSGIAAVHCPASSLRRGSGLPPVAALHARGITVGLGSGGAAGVGTADVLAEARLATLLAAGLDGEAGCLDAQAALALATLGGARAIGLDTDIGSLVVGKSADFIAIDLAHAPGAGTASAAQTILYDATRADVSDVWVAGRHVVQRGHLELLDLGEVERQARQWMVRMGLGAAA